jgi:hypothetical protein
VKRNIDIVLEGYRRVRKAEGYNYIFVVPVTSAEGCFLFVAFLNTNSVVGVLDIDLTKDL